MHTALWRLDVDLNGSIPNTVNLYAHFEGLRGNLLAAADTIQPFNGGLEGSGDWDPLAFNSLVVENPGTLNSHGNPIGYELVPLRTGTARHYGSRETYTLHDFWVTVYHRSEAGYTAPYDWHLNEALAPDDYLVPNATIGPESVVDNDVILWYLASAHHDPHDEDHASSDTSPEMKGLTLTHWLGFDLVPHNLFDYNPLGGPHRDQCDGKP
jgi:Cu2+-containing amine oxidase